MVGTVVRVDGVPFTVMGIAPAQTARWARSVGVWLPYTAQPQLEPVRGQFRQSEIGWLSLAGRLASGFSRRQAQTELRVVARRQDRLHPDRETEVTVTDGSWFQDPDVPARIYWILALIAGAPGQVLLIACANVTTLPLSRAASRQREIAVRLSVGAARFRILRMLLTESLLPAAIAGAISARVAHWAPGALFHFLAREPADSPLSPDWGIFARLCGVILLTGCLAGLAPAIESLRVDLAESLNLITAVGGLPNISTPAAASICTENGSPQTGELRSS